jgi:cell division protein FtsW
MQHVRNLAIGGVIFVTLTFINYRIWKRFVIFLLLFTIGSLIAVLLFSDYTFGARRAFLEGSYQPGELAELTVVVYMAAWLGSKNTKVSSITHGLIPFMVLTGIIGGLVALQPDLSTTVTIFVVAGIMFFLAGANVLHMGGALAIMGVGGYAITESFSYAQGRFGSFIAGLTDFTQTNYHAQQAMIAFLNGGWMGVGLGQGSQKFGFLPTPHTDSIFAVIGEELGFIGAIFVILLYVLLVIRGLQIARKAHDPFGSLLAAGVTLWIITKALLNIAVMVNLIPSTGVALPFISYGGSSLITLLAGAGLLFSVARRTAIENSPEGRISRAHDDRGWGNRWTRLSGNSGRRSADRATPRR